MAAAGWLWASESGPVTEVGFGVLLGLAAGVALALVAGDAAGLAAGDDTGLVAGAGLCSGAAIGPAGAGFFCANSATVNCIACVMGIRATPFVLSTHP